MKIDDMDCFKFFSADVVPTFFEFPDQQLGNFIVIHIHESPLEPPHLNPDGL